MTNQTDSVLSGNSAVGGQPERVACITMGNGVVIALVTAMVAWLWHGNPYLGLVIGLGMLVNLIFAGFLGASIPILMKKFDIERGRKSIWNGPHGISCSPD